MPAWKGLVAVQTEEAWPIENWSTTHWEVDLAPCGKLQEKLVEAFTNVEAAITGAPRATGDAQRITNARNLIQQVNLTDLLETLSPANVSLSTIPTLKADQCSTRVFQYLDAHECALFQAEIETAEYLLPALEVPFNVTNQKQMLVTLGLTTLTQLATRYNDYMEKLSETLTAIRAGTIPEELYPFIMQSCLDIFHDCKALPENFDDLYQSGALAASYTTITRITRENKNSSEFSFAVSVQAPCLSKTVGKFVLRTAPYMLPDEQTYELALPHFSDVWFAEHNGQYVTTFPPTNCARHGNPPLQICDAISRVPDDSMFMPRGGTQHLSISAIELPWETASNLHDSTSQNMADHIFQSGNELLAFSAQARLAHVSCANSDVGQNATTANLSLFPSQPLRATLRSSCSLQLKNLTGHLLQAFNPYLQHANFVLPRFLTFSDGTLNPIAEALLTHWLDNVQENLTEYWPFYIGGVTGIGLLIAPFCFLLSGCHKQKKVRPRRRSQRAGKFVYMRQLSPSSPAQIIP
jgi:hypothetical protein